MTSLLMIGCGNMGGALLAGWMNSSVAEELERFDIVKPSAPDASLQFDEVNFHTSLDAITHTPTIIVLAVKPHQLEKVIPEAVEKFGDEPLYISIAAGKTLAGLQAYAGGDYKLIRAMPNTPVAVNVGITGLCATENLTEDDERWVESLFASVGLSAWTPEEQMNALTALCGSGPAYVFYFMECLAKAAGRLGLDEAVADGLVRQMLLGASELAISSDEEISTLRENVTSPNGTTAAALDIWMRVGTLNTQAIDALKAAKDRAEELES